MTFNSCRVAVLCRGEAVVRVARLDPHEPTQLALDADQPGFHYHVVVIIGDSIRSRSHFRVFPCTLGPMERRCIQGASELAEKFLMVDSCGIIWRVRLS